MKFLKYFWFVFILSALLNASTSSLDAIIHDLKATGGKEVVHQAIADTVEKVNCQIVGSGSHI